MKKIKKKPDLPKIITSFGRKSSPVTSQGTFDSDGLKMSEKGMEVGEYDWVLDDFEKVKELGFGAQGVVNEVVYKDGKHFAMKGL